MARSFQFQSHHEDLHFTGVTDAVTVSLDDPVVLTHADFADQPLGKDTPDFTVFDKVTATGDDLTHGGDIPALRLYGFLADSLDDFSEVFAGKFTSVHCGVG